VLIAVWRKADRIHTPLKSYPASPVASQRVGMRETSINALFYK